MARHMHGPGKHWLVESLEGIAGTVLWGVMGATIALGLRAMVAPVLDDRQPYLTLFPVLVFVTFAAGWVAGALGLSLGAIALVYMVVAPARGLPGLELAEVFGLMLAVAVGVVVIVVSERLRRLRQASDQAAAEARSMAESLQDSEERFRRLAELSPDAILVLSEGVFVYANEATVRLLCATDRRQVIGQSVYSIVHPESRPIIEARLGRLLATGQPNPPAEHRVFRFDGEEITVEAASTLVPWRGGAGEAGNVAVQVIARDVTDRKRAEQELRESKQTMDDFFENSPVAIHWIDLNGCIARANRAELEMLGYTEEEYVGRPIRDFHLNPSDADHLLKRLFSGETLKQCELRLRARDGVVHDALLDATVHRRNGNIVNTCCFMVDVTEQRRSQEAVQAALERFRLCSRATNDVLYDWDITANRIEWNEVFRSITGDLDESVISRFDWWLEQLHSDDLDRVNRTINEALKSGSEQWTCEYRFRRFNGTYVTILDRAFISRDEEGRPIRMVGAMIDMTERRLFEDELARRATELERSNADLEDFAHIISHDLKAPLRGIADYAGYLLNGYSDRVDDDGRDMLHTLVRLSGRMHELLDALLEYGQVGRAELRTAKCDLNTALGHVLESLRSRLESEHVQVVLTSRLPVATCDPVLLEQVFSNLIVNGLKYNTNEIKRIEIGCRDGEDGQPITYVRDNGIGIPARHQEAIFQMFRRLHSRDRFGGGTGSGLSIVKKIVERHGGRIWVESIPGEGSTFQFTLGTIEEEPPMTSIRKSAGQASSGA